MAETSHKIPPPNRRLHFLLRCFGSSPEIRTGKDPATLKPHAARRNRRIPWFRSRFKKSSATVPVDAAVPEITHRCAYDGFLSPEFKKPAPIAPKAPAVGAEIVAASGTEPTRPSRGKTVPSRTRNTTESTQSDSTAESFPPATRTAAFLHSVSHPSRRSNRQKDLIKSASQIRAAFATAAPAPKPSTKSPVRIGKSEKANPRKKFDTVIIMSAVAITVLWGRLCAILCTAALFYLRRRLGSEMEPDGGG